MAIESPRFAPVDRRTLPAEVRDRLVQAIRSGQLPPGAQLPSERVLCEDFGVARASVREALQGLLFVGLLERRGNRLHIAETLPEITVSPTSTRERVRELFEVRRLIEPRIAGLPAARASPAERVAIRSLAERFNANMPLAEFRALDREFHWMVADACRNKLFAELYSKVLDSLFRSSEFASILAANRNRKAVRTIIRDSAAAHSAIADALVKGDAEHVMRAAESHLHQVEEQLIAQLSDENEPRDRGEGATVNVALARV